MKKVLTLLVFLLIAPIIVLADEPRVLTLEATKNSNVISFSGTTEAGSLAVMCKLLDDGAHEVNMKSVEVDYNNVTNKYEFEGTITAPAVGEYTVACANYEGGAITESDPVNVTEVTVITYTVTFVDGENEISHTLVNAGETVTRPQDPTKDNYTFIDWFEDNTLNVVFDFEHNEIYDDTTIYAKWQNAAQPPAPNEAVAVHTIFMGEGGTYRVSFNTDDPQNQGALNASVNSSQAYFVPAGEEMTLIAEPEEGWTFDGWYSVHEEEVNNHMEWIRDVRVSTNTEYTFEPNGTPYIMPVFEDHRMFLVHVNTNGGDPINDIEVNSGDLLEPPVPHRDGYTFIGWFADDTFNVEFDFNEPITGELTIYAKWEENENPEPGNGGGEEPEKDTPYDVDDGEGNSISFSEESGHTFTFVVIDIMSLTEAEFEELTGGAVTKEEYVQLENALKEKVKDKGELLSIYEMLVFDENDHEIEDGPFDIKLAMTPEMEDYENFKLLYVDFDNNFEILETIPLDAKNGSLTGQLQHLSNYVLVATKVATNETNEEPGTTTNNEITNNTTETTTATENKTETAKTSSPKTFDNIYVWVITLIISIIGLSLGVFKAKKCLKINE